VLNIPLGKSLQHCNKNDILRFLLYKQGLVESRFNELLVSLSCDFLYHIIMTMCYVNVVMYSVSRNLGNGRVSRVEGHRSRVEGHKSRVIGRGSKVEVEVQKSRSRVKSRGPGSKVEVEGQKSRVEIQESKMGNINFLLIHF
jgi:hypothetical protein